MVGTVKARVSVLPVVGSELPTDSDAAVVVTEYVDDVRGDTLDAVDEGVGRSCVRSDSAEVWPVLHDERSVMSFLTYVLDLSVRGRIPQLNRLEAALRQ